MNTKIITIRDEPMRLRSKRRFTFHNKKEYLYPILIFCYYFIFIYLFSTQFRDDIGYLQRYNDMGIIEASLDNYLHWSSRIVLEIALMFFTKYFFLWKFSYAVVMTGTIMMISTYAFRTWKNESIFLPFLFLNLFPLFLMDEAGWVATSLNYAFPLFALLLSFFPIYKLLINESVAIHWWIISFLALIFGGNQEQFNLCFIVLLVILSFYLIKKKRAHIFMIPIFLLSLFHLTLFLTTPGNKERIQAETTRWFPEFEKFGLITKVDLGFSSFIRTIFLEFSVPLFIFFLLLAFIAFYKSKSKFVRISGLFPILTNLAFTISPFFYYSESNFQFSNFYEQIFQIVTFRDKFSSLGTGLVLFDIHTWGPTILGFMLVISVLIVLLFTLSSINKSILASILFIMILCSRVILGFSPTVWASGIRTFYLSFIIITLLTMFLIEELSTQQKKLISILFPFLCTSMILSALTALVN